MKQASAIILVLFLVACGNPDHNRPTSLDQSVASACIKSRSVYNGHMDFCDSTRLCAASIKNEAKALAAEANMICAIPNDTEANRIRLWGIVNRQIALGGAK